MSNDVPSPRTGVMMPKIAGLFKNREVATVIRVTPSRQGASRLQDRRLVDVQIYTRTFEGHAPVTQDNVYFNGISSLSSTGEAIPAEHDAHKVRDLVIKNGETTVRVALSLEDLAALDRLTQ